MSGGRRAMPPRVHARGSPGGHCDYRNTDRDSVAGRSERPRGCSPHPMRKQPKANWNRAALPSRRLGNVASGRLCHDGRPVSGRFLGHQPCFGRSGQLDDPDSSLPGTGRALQVLQFHQAERGPCESSGRDVTRCRIYLPFGPRHQPVDRAGDGTGGSVGRSTCPTCPAPIGQCPAAATAPTFSTAGRSPAIRRNGAARCTWWAFSASVPSGSRTLRTASRTRSWSASRRPEPILPTGPCGLIPSSIIRSRRRRRNLAFSWAITTLCCARAAAGPTFLAAAVGEVRIRGGLNFILCDGSGTFLSTSIDMNLFADLATIAGGETSNLPSSP